MENKIGPAALRLTLVMALMDRDMDAAATIAHAKELEEFINEDGSADDKVADLRLV